MDSLVPVTNQLPYDWNMDGALRSRSLSQAKSVLPLTLTIRYSVLDGSGYGIYSKAFIPKGTRFGPYEGIQVHSSQKGRESCCWQVVTKSNTMEILNGQEEEGKSNWLKYVNYARNEDHQNLTAVHCQENVYFIAHKDITANSELLVWYCQYCYNGIATMTRELCIGNEVGSTGSLWHKIHQGTPYKYMNQNDCSSSLQKCNFFNKELSLSALKEHQFVNKARFYTCKICHNKFTNTRNENLCFTKICDACDIQLASSHKGSKVPEGEYIGNNCDVNTDVGIFGEASSFELDNVSKMDVKKTKGENSSCSSTYSFETVQKEKDTCSHDNVFCPSSVDYPLQIKIKLNECGIHDRRLSESYNLHCSCDNLSIGKKSESNSFPENSIMEKHTAEKLSEYGMHTKMFSQSCGLFKPRKSCSGERSDEDELCNITIIENYEAEQHVMQYEEKLYDSSLCDKELVYNSKILKHKRIHTAKNVYECDICCKKFSNMSGLNKHKMIHTGEKPYECDVCRRHFATHWRLKKHGFIHTGEKPFKCNYCDKKFIDNSSLCIHERIHTGEKPYECDICGKGFAQNSCLWKHKRIHTGERPYECDLCGKRFKQNAHLYNHKTFHIGKKGYECDLCDKKFVQQSSLCRHKKKHYEKPHQCLVCGEKFSKYVSLCQHKRVHSDKMLYQCDICKQAYSHKSSMYKHKRIVHCTKSNENDEQNAPVN